jgi:glycosyltransferase involved in cell wall biosynthesis
MKRPLNICIITQQLGKIFSGPGTYSRLLIRKLIQDNHNVHVILPNKQLPDVVDFSYQLVPNSRVSSHARWIELSFSFNKALRENYGDFDLVHFTDIRDSYFVNCEFPIISNINDTYLTQKRTLGYLQNNYKDWLQRYFYYTFSRFIEHHRINKSNIIIANSYYTKKILLQNYSTISKKVFVCYKTIDFTRFLNTSITKYADFFNILFVGGNMERKGIISIINSSPNVISRYKNVKYHIIGEDPKLNYYINLCKDLGVHSNFIFHGNITPENLKHFYNMANLFLLPSIEEALGISILEAMANNIPVIATKVGGITEIITNNTNGILLEPNNTQELSDKIIKIIDDKQLRDRIIKNAKITIKKFSNETMFDCTYKLYSKIVG